MEEWEQICLVLFCFVVLMSLLQSLAITIVILGMLVCIFYYLTVPDP